MPSLETYAAAASVAGVGTWLVWKLKAAGRAPTPNPQASVRALGDLLEEIRKTSRSMADSMDRRAVELKALVAEADRRIETLKGLQTAPVQPVQAAQASPGAGPEADLARDVSPEMKKVFDDVYRQADQGRAVTDIARENGLNKTAVSLILGLREMHRHQTDDAPGRSGAPR